MASHRLSKNSFYKFKSFFEKNLFLYCYTYCHIVAKYNWLCDVFLTTADSDTEL